MLENIIYNGDSVEGMKNLVEEVGGTIDCILTDPPYNVSQKSNFHTMGRKGVDFGEWDKGFDLTSWIEPALKLLKKGGNIVIFNDWKNMSYIKDELEKHGCLIKEIIMWQKTNPMPRNRDRLYVTSCEFAIWATKGKEWTYNRQRETYENAIFRYPVVHHSKRYHVTEKPLELIKDLVKIHTNENDIVLDPFMGSGTTAVACKELRRKYVGFELDKEYHEISLKRLTDLD